MQSCKFYIKGFTSLCEQEMLDFYLKAVREMSETRLGLLRTQEFLTAKIPFKSLPTKGTIHMTTSLGAEITTSCRSLALISKSLFCMPNFGTIAGCCTCRGSITRSKSLNESQYLDLWN